jgi:hypothetical protein
MVFLDTKVDEEALQPIAVEDFKSVTSLAEEE